MAFEILTDDVRLQATQAYRAAHREEILKTLEIVESSESGEYAIVFFRYSIGTDIFRETLWAGKVQGKWYLLPELRYLDTKSTDRDWFVDMDRKKLEWEKESAVNPMGSGRKTSIKLYLSALSLSGQLPAMTEPKGARLKLLIYSKPNRCPLSIASLYLPLLRPSHENALPAVGLHDSCRQRPCQHLHP